MKNAKRCRAGEFLYGSAYLFCRELRFEIHKFLRAGQTDKISRRVAIDAVFSLQEAGPQFLYQKIVCFRVVGIADAGCFARHKAGWPVKGGVAFQHGGTKTAFRGISVSGKCCGYIAVSGKAVSFLRFCAYLRP